MDLIVDLVSKGNWLTIAVAHAGISERVLHLWLARARDARDAAEEHNPDNPTDPTWTPTPIPQDMTRYVHFLQRLERARAQAESHAVETIHQVITGGYEVKRRTRFLPDGSEETEVEVTPPDGKLALEYLARVDPERWGRAPTQRVEITGKDGGAIAVEASSSVDALAERFASLRAIESGEAKGVDVEDAVLVEGDV
jgi:hypothetical protein